MQDGAL